MGEAVHPPCYSSGLRSPRPRVYLLCCCCSVSKLYPTLCDSMACRTRGFPVLHYLLEFAQIHVNGVDNAIQPSHTLSTPSLPTLNLSQQGSFPMSQLIASGGQSIGTSASDFPVNIQGWLPFGLTHFILLQSKELSRVFSSTTVRKHQFFSAQPSLWSNSHIHTWLLEK